MLKDFIQKEITRIRRLFGDRVEVVGAVSGGVDSTVVAKSMKEAIGTTTDLQLGHVLAEKYPSDRFYAIFGR